MGLSPVETSCGRTIQPDLSPSTRLVVLASVTEDFVNVFPLCVFPPEHLSLPSCSHVFSLCKIHSWSESKPFKTPWLLLLQVRAWAYSSQAPVAGGLLTVMENELMKNCSQNL